MIGINFGGLLKEEGRLCYDRAKYVCMDCTTSRVQWEKELVSGGHLFGGKRRAPKHNQKFCEKISFSFLFLPVRSQLIFL